MVWITVACAFAVLLAIAFVVLFRALLSPSSQAVNSKRVKDFTLARYKPLLRLLGEEDYQFIRSLPAYEPAMEKSLRKRRNAAISGYLRALSKDFEMLHKSARMMLAHGEVNRPELLPLLIRQSITFRYAMTVIRIRLAWNNAGLPKVSVDFGKILGPAGWLHSELRTLAVAPAQQA